VSPPSLYFFARHMQNLILPSHRTIKALRIERSNLFINEMRTRRQIQFVIGFQPAVLGSAKDADFARFQRKLRGFLRLRGGFGLRRSPWRIRMRCLNAGSRCACQAFAGTRATGGPRLLAAGLCLCGRRRLLHRVGFCFAFAPAILSLLTPFRKAIIHVQRIESCSAVQMPAASLSDQFPSPFEDGIEHRLGQLAGKSVLLTWMKRSKQRSLTVELTLDSMSERGSPSARSGFCCGLAINR